MHYKIGWPFAEALASIGIPTLLRVDVIMDEAAGVFVGTSPDLRGLVLEAESFEELVAEARDVIPCLFAESTTRRFTCR